MWSLLFSLCLRRFSSSTQASSHSPRTCFSVSDAKMTTGVNGYAYRYDNPASTVKPAYRLHPHDSELDKQQIKLMYR